MLIRICVITNMNIPDSSVKRLAQVFKLLGEPNRLRILCSLGLECRPVTDVIRATGLEQTNVSFHLRALREAGLVRPERRGPFIYYCLHDPELLNIVANLNTWLTNGHREGGRKARSKAVELVCLPGCVPKRVSRGNGKAAASR